MALGEEADAARVGEVVTQAARETTRQFHDIVFAAPQSEGPLGLSAGERFLRLHLSIWPQQQWLIDQELLPPVRRAMKAQGLDIPNGKISVLYHPRKSRPISPRRRRQDPEDVKC